MAKSKENYSGGDKLLASDKNQDAKNANDAGGYNDALLAGENLTGASTPQPITIINADDLKVVKDQSQEVGANQSNVFGVNFVAQSFTLGINSVVDKITLKLEKQGSPSGNLSLDIYAVDGSGKPTGSSLGTATIEADAINSGSQLLYTLEFPTVISLSPSTQYAIVLSLPTGDGSNLIYWSYTNTTAYSGGGKITSSDSGSNWGSVSGSDDQYFEVWAYEDLTNSRVYNSEADNINRLQVDGFILNSPNAGDASEIQTNSGIIRGFSGLTIGAKYYLQDDGTIGISKGTYTVPVGTAISSTELLFTRPDYSLYSFSKSENQQINDSQEENTASVSMVKIKEIEVNFDGIIRTQFDGKDIADVSDGRARIYLNGVADGNEIILIANYSTYVHDVNVSKGDLVQLYARQISGTASSLYVKNFKLLYDQLPKEYSEIQSV